MTDKVEKELLDWGWDQVVLAAGIQTTFSDGCREWFDTFFLWSAQQLSADLRQFRAAKRNFAKKLKFMGEYVRGMKDVSAEQLEQARQKMTASLGGTIYCDPPPIKEQWI
jgi:hypothetical protein